MTTATVERKPKKNGPAPTYGKRRFFGLRLEQDDADYLLRVAQPDINGYLAKLVKADRAAREQDSSSRAA